jgi:predicted MFS family arabinose efflux permease
MVMPIAMAYVGDIAPEGREGSYMGYLNIALFAGIGVGPLLGGAFGDVLGIQSAFYAMGSLSALSFVLVLLFLPAKVPGEAQEEMRPMVTVAREMSRNPRVMGILMTRLASMMAMPPSFVFLPLLMTGFMDAGGFEIGLVLASRTLINAFVQAPMGRYADSHDKVALSTWGALAVVAVMVAVPFAQSMGQLIALYMLMGLFEAVLWPAISALAVEEGRTYGMGSMMGVFNMAMSIGIFGGAMATGMAAEAWGLAAAFYVGAGLFGVGTIIGWRLMASSPASRPRPAGAGVGPGA